MSNLVNNLLKINYAEKKSHYEQLKSKNSKNRTKFLTTISLYSSQRSA